MKLKELYTSLKKVKERLLPKLIKFNSNHYFVIILFKYSRIYLSIGVDMSQTADVLEFVAAQLGGQSTEFAASNSAARYKEKLLWQCEKARRRNIRDCLSKTQNVGGTQQVRYIWGGNGRDVSGQDTSSDKSKRSRLMSEYGIHIE